VISTQDPAVQRFKPDTRGLQVVLERMGIASGQALYAGDRPQIDGRAAGHAGTAFSQWEMAI
jgi:FMN phosphatase YigB (HAD superfamily)